MYTRAKNKGGAVVGHGPFPAAGSELAGSEPMVVLQARAGEFCFICRRGVALIIRLGARKEGDFFSYLGKMITNDNLQPRIPCSAGRRSWDNWY